MSPQHKQLMQAQVRALEAQQQAQAQAQGQGQAQPGQAQPQQPAIQVQVQNPPTQPTTQPLVTTMQFTNSMSASPPQQTVSPNSGTPGSINGSSNGGGGATTQGPALVQNQVAITTPSPLEPDTTDAAASIGTLSTAPYFNVVPTLQSMFEINDGATVNPNGSAQTRFQATPQVCTINSRLCLTS